MCNKDCHYPQETKDCDYEECGCCGFDHSYEYEDAVGWHINNPCSYCHYNPKVGHEIDCQSGLVERID